MNPIINLLSEVEFVEFGKKRPSAGNVGPEKDFENNQRRETNWGKNYGPVILLLCSKKSSKGVLAVQTSKFIKIRNPRTRWGRVGKFGPVWALWGYSCNHLPLLITMS
jgi:hypothetical protein